MKKILLFLATHLGKVDTLHDKITAVYNVWNTIYGYIQPLLPAKTPVVAPNDLAAVPAAAPPPGQVPIVL